MSKQARFVGTKPSGPLGTLSPGADRARANMASYAGLCVVLSALGVFGLLGRLIRPGGALERVQGAHWITSVGLFFDVLLMVLPIAGSWFSYKTFSAKFQGQRTRRRWVAATLCCMFPLTTFVCVWPLGFGMGIWSLTHAGDRGLARPPSRDKPLLSPRAWVGASIGSLVLGIAVCIGVPALLQPSAPAQQNHDLGVVRLHLIEGDQTDADIDEYEGHTSILSDNGGLMQQVNWMRRYDLTRETVETVVARQEAMMAQEMGEGIRLVLLNEDLEVAGAQAFRARYSSADSAIQGRMTYLTCPGSDLVVLLNTGALKSSSAAFVDDLHQNTEVTTVCLPPAREAARPADIGTFSPPSRSWEKQDSPGAMNWWLDERHGEQAMSVLYRTSKLEVTFSALGRCEGTARQLLRIYLGTDGWTLTDFTAHESSRISCVGEARGEVDIDGQAATFIAWVELVPCGDGWHRGSVYQTFNTRFRANAGRMWNCSGP